MKLFKKILPLGFVLNCMILVGQSNTSSPYSTYGIGDIRTNGSAQSKAMGGTGIALQSESSLNNLNPASYRIDSLLFLIETGFDARLSQFTNSRQTNNNGTFNLSYLALGFRNTKWWINSLGLAPYSSVGNNLVTTRSIEGTTNSSEVTQKGSGGLNQCYWGNSVNVYKNLWLGVNFSYIFGTIKQIQSTTSNYYSGSLETEDKSHISKLYLSYGFQYSFDIKKDVKATIGGIFGANSKFNLNHTTTNYGNAGDTLTEPTTTTSKFSLPPFFGLGASVQMSDKLLITADYQFHRWSQSESTVSSVKMVNSTNYAVGAEYKPSNSIRTSFMEHVKYRIGGYYNSSYMMISGHQLMDRGLTAGIGLPLIGNKLNMSMMYGIGRNSALGNSGLVSETYHSFMINISLTELWFMKTKYD